MTSRKSKVLLQSFLLLFFFITLQFLQRPLLLNTACSVRSCCSWKRLLSPLGPNVSQIRSFGIAISWTLIFPITDHNSNHTVVCPPQRERFSIIFSSREPFKRISQLKTLALYLELKRHLCSIGQGDGFLVSDHWEHYLEADQKLISPPLFVCDKNRSAVALDRRATIILDFGDINLGRGQTIADWNQVLTWWWR